MPSSNRVEKNLPTSNKLKHCCRRCNSMRCPLRINLIFKKVRPAIPAQKPNQPRLWLDCACQRWSRKPNHRRAAPDTIFRTTLTGAGEPYNGRGERAGIHPVQMHFSCDQFFSTILFVNQKAVSSVIVSNGSNFSISDWNI